jgi:hypothetical protein
MSDKLPGCREALKHLDLALEALTEDSDGNTNSTHRISKALLTIIGKLRFFIATQGQGQV